MTQQTASTSLLVDDVLQDFAAHLETLKSGDAPVGPGNPETLSAAAGVNEYIAQGDLFLNVTDKIPKGYTKVDKLTEAHLQLVPGNTQGARHCLSTLTGIEMWLPSNFNATYEGLEGPLLRSEKAFVVLHPIHGDVTVDKGVCSSKSGQYVWCTYAREYDLEQKRERRNAD